ncbi:hypothetical protein EIM50_08830 [Pseudoxanthomonas sp. SGD-10]|jgi:Outer membrane lipoprotein|uniref:glycine zipper domain-containing protein n=1 Tax=Pseudoxanthomonas sp. J31 TaxID=935851 RepID=UPI00041ABE10|nr:glycine zipper domain-containing protein [Pseudoxanthomonas sp. J31]RRN79364.1 hypothetical protein EIM50_08830 [Pseudoxanthomonas sp. SGD-10]
MSKEPRDLNRDPITGAPGSHPVGVGVGGTGGAVAGAAVGSLLGPIGTLVGGAVGALAGAAAGKNVAERLDPTAEAEYWRTEYANRPYNDPGFDYDSDYAPAYRYGLDVREQSGAGQRWDASLEARARSGWEQARGGSRLTWEQARDAVRDAFERSDRTYRAYEATDGYYADQYEAADYYLSDYDYEDYRPAYRYGTYARSNLRGRVWDAELEQELERGWESARGSSRLDWEDARDAVWDAWHGAERLFPDDGYTRR